jgi:hypothetical protein
MSTECGARFYLIADEYASGVGRGEGFARVWLHSRVPLTRGSDLLRAGRSVDAERTRRGGDSSLIGLGEGP